VKRTNWHTDAVSEEQILLWYGDKNGQLRGIKLRIHCGGVRETEGVRAGIQGTNSASAPLVME
jgi:hypothetical protein